ncbi:unnamed protein product, partial [Meganyctiphanes norvegica]
MRALRLVASLPSQIISRFSSSDAEVKTKLIQDSTSITVDDDNSRGYGKRHQLVLLGFLGFAVVYAMRVNLSVAIVAMVKNRPETLKQDNVALHDTCPLPPGQASSRTKPDRDGEFDWDEKTQGLVLGCFFYGYLLTNFLGGRLAEHLGGRLVFGLGVLLTAILTVLSPFAARHSTFAFILIRILEGMTEGVTFPAMSVMMSFWIPPLERARATSRILGGCQFGTVITLMTSGWLCESQWGWPAVFYIFGGLGIVWAWYWFKIVYDCPDMHPSISRTELKYIKEGLGEHKKGERLVVPLHSMFTSRPFLTVILVHCGNNVGFYCLLTELPTYLKNIQHYDIKANINVTRVIFRILIFCLPIFSPIKRILGRIPLTNIRVRSNIKIMVDIGNFVPMVVLCLMPWAGCDRQLAVFLLCIAIGATGTTFCGHLCAFQELAPNFAGTLTGISNTFATIPGFLAPIMTGAIINNQQTLSRWQEVFKLVSLVYLIVAVVYMLFITDKVQPWNDAQPEKKKKPTSGLSKAV